MMQHIKQINILDMMKMYGEDSCKAVLSTFMCPLKYESIVEPAGCKRA